MTRSLWQRDPDTVHALNAGTLWWASRRHRFGLPSDMTRTEYLRVTTGWRWNGRTILPARPVMPWGRTVGRPTGMSHVPRFMLVAWMRGVVRGARVIWYCGTMTDNFELGQVLSGRQCQRCLFAAGRLTPRIDVRVQVAVHEGGEEGS